MRPVGGVTPNSAARWPIESGPAAAVDKYEDAPHGATSRTTGPALAVRDRRFPTIRDVRLETLDRPTDLRDSPHERPARASPTIVARAFDVSRRAGYVSFCRNETGRLLATLAATRGGTLAEFGTGCGVGTAWLRSGVAARTPDPLRRAGRQARRRGAGDLRRRPAGRGARRRLVDAARQGPVLAAVPGRRRAPEDAGVDAVADLVEPGGIVVLDDFTPCEMWPPISDGRVDIAARDTG